MASPAHIPRRPVRPRSLLLSRQGQTCSASGHHRSGPGMQESPARVIVRNKANSQEPVGERKRVPGAGCDDVGRLCGCEQTKPISEGSLLPRIRCRQAPPAVVQTKPISQGPRRPRVRPQARRRRASLPQTVRNKANFRRLAASAGSTPAGLSTPNGAKQTQFGGNRNQGQVLPGKWVMIVLVRIAAAKNKANSRGSRPGFSACPKTRMQENGPPLIFSVDTYYAI